VIKVTGDFAGLKRIEDKLRKAADAKRDILRALEEEAINQVNEGFDGQRDPYGAGWASTIRGGKTLRDTGGLKGSLHRSRDSSSFTIGFSKMYAAVHQYGATIKAKTSRGLLFKIGKQWVRKQVVKIRARPMLPSGSRGLPASWVAAFVKSGNAALRKILRG